MTTMMDRSTESRPLRGRIAVAHGRAAAVALSRAGADVAGIDIAGKVSPIIDFAPATVEDLSERGVTRHEDRYAQAITVAGATPSGDEAKIGTPHRAVETEDAAWSSVGRARGHRASGRLLATDQAPLVSGTTFRHRRRQRELHRVNRGLITVSR
jgi:hypothetical protein